MSECAHVNGRGHGGVGYACAPIYVWGSTRTDGTELGPHLHALHNHSQMHSKHAQLLAEVTLFTLQDTEE